MTEWAGDWSYGYLRALMTKAGAHRRFALLSSAPAVLAAEEAVVFVRHDIDMSLGRARALAEREAEWGVVSTYHVMLSCPFYDVTTASSREAIAAIRALGHEVGLHFHPSVDGGTTRTPEEAIARACERFEEVTGGAVPSVSFHMPEPTMMGGPLTVAGRVNAYAAPLLAFYLSDSAARWREGNPLDSLDKPRAKHLQLLVHPLWWGDENEVPAVRLRKLVDELAAERGEPVERLADVVYEHILVRPS